MKHITIKQGKKKFIIEELEPASPKQHIYMIYEEDTEYHNLVFKFTTKNLASAFLKIAEKMK